jgi:regulator of replication initiation timing
MEPDAEQLAEQAARRLLEQAGRYVREALALPEQVEVLQSITANLMFENAALRLDVQRLTERVDALERQRGYRQVRSEEITVRDVLDHENLRKITDRVDALERRAGGGR